MAVYSVLAPPPPDMSADTDPVAFVFVKDGFCWPCLFVPELWMLFRRLWLVLLIYIVVAAVLVDAAIEVAGPLPRLFLLLAHFYFALEANGLRRWTLQRRGYRLVGVASGRNTGEAEIRFFHAYAEPASPRDPRQPPPGRIQAAISPPRPTAESGEVVGFFPVPGGSQ